MNRKFSIIAASAALALSLVMSAAFPAAADNHRTLHIVTTGDVHGAYFPDSYTGGPSKTSIMSVKHYVDSLRNAVGADNVLLLDAGDILQGDNASYYFNYVATNVPHVMPRLFKYMGYDVSAVGNHDMETGHPVYDRVRSQFEEYGIPWLAANTPTPDGKSYFQPYVILNRAGAKVAVLGFTNPAMHTWLSDELLSGMEFESLIPSVQKLVDKVRAEEHPDVVVVVCHSGTGKGDGSSLESQGMDVFNELKGADVIVTAHDHRPFTAKRDKFVLINGGAKAAAVGHAVVELESGKVKDVNGEVVRMNKELVDEKMRETFRPEYEAVKAFTLKPSGVLDMTLSSRDAYKGMNDFVNLIQTVQLEVSGADISFAAPLTFNGTVPAGQLVFNDMFTIYPYENQMFVATLKGSEIKNYLEYDYDLWIQNPSEHVLKIAERPDPRNGAKSWSFTSTFYNFDSAAGINYTVDVTKPFGQRVNITSLANGKPFDLNADYSVAMTSYRANGGGFLIPKGAGIDNLNPRITARYPEIRELIYKYFMAHKSVSHEMVSNPSVIGSWKFVPEETVAPMMENDLKLIFGKL